MIRIYVSPEGEGLQKPEHEIARVHSVAKAYDIAVVEYTIRDSTMRGMIQTVSDRTGYVFDEFVLYEYDCPVEAVDTPPVLQ